MSVIESYGGIRWEPAPEAIKLIRSETGCDEAEAIEMLRAWTSDKRVETRRLGGPGTTIAELMAIALVARASPMSAAARLGVLDANLLEIDMHQLRELLAPPAEADVPPKRPLDETSKPASVSEPELVHFLKNKATKEMKKKDLRKSARAELGSFSDKTFDAAYKQIPLEQRREPGDTGRKLKREQAISQS